ncbi:helicase [Methanomicrobium sp. W14]|uniref:DEAD/DEAH box helicase n=1 Tax=Methanomicrobium sp. W14 TaxID=2817839 RepID=UPI001AE9892A|nr:DEAD/DEAH box helicase [Methanomicrobium sp. W14]MBP2133028.1 helicase [Methanomicrobium sp. W14]
MKVIVSPQRGDYKLFFYDKHIVEAEGAVELAKTSKGFRPKNYRLRITGKRQLSHAPTKELISALRNSDVRLTCESKNFESFLNDLQINFGYVRACRMCILENRITPLKKKNAVKYGKEYICLQCAENELRREIGFLGKMGGISTSHLERLLEMYMDLDKVLSMVQPERIDLKNTIFDVLESHKVTKTTDIEELPLPRRFKEASGVKDLMPVQQLCVEAGLLEGKDQLVVAATASGKTFIGEMAGVKNQSEGRGNMLFLVPLVALANQKYSRFAKRYPFLCVSLQTGVSRINIPENKVNAKRTLKSNIIVGTYEGIDNILRRGRTIPNIGTVVIDEVQTLEDPERGHRLDGLISRLKYIAPHAQFLYLSATIGLPHLLAEKINANLVTYNERPVPLERHLIFLERKQKIEAIKRLVTQEYRNKSSKGYKGQSIVFTYSRARCHEIADAIGRQAEAYHAGLSAKEKRAIEEKFEKGEISAVITTAALAAGVDFPASQVIFDALAMGIKWLTVQDFSQMMGRAGRPDYHDLGKVVILAEPGGSYSHDTKLTEEEVAIGLLKGEMEEVAPVYDDEESSEEYISNAVVCRGDERGLMSMCSTMVGEMSDVYPQLKRKGYISLKDGKVVLSPFAKVMAEHFIGIERLERLRYLVKKVRSPVEIVAELECEKGCEKK